MNEQILAEYYRKRGIAEDETEKALSVLNSFQSFLLPDTEGIENCSADRAGRFLLYYAGQNKADASAVTALTRAAHLSGNMKLYIYLLQISERGNIIDNMKKHIENELGAGQADALFSGLAEPGCFEPPEKALNFTRALVEAVDSGKLLQANAHGVPAEAFAKEAEHFHNSADLRSYLKGAHERIVAVLQTHANSGEIWFEQFITQPVVDFVAANPEVLAGVFDGSRIYFTKIPYNPDAWLKETDPAKRRYLACHCPMARESLNPEREAEKIPGKWCNCTAGFVKQRFNAVFGAETEVEMVESVLDGDERCRFAVHVPNKIL